MDMFVIEQITVNQTWFSYLGYNQHHYIRATILVRIV